MKKPLGGAEFAGSFGGSKPDCPTPAKLVPFPSVLRDLVREFERAAPHMTPADGESAGWWRYAVVLDMLNACAELTATDPDYDGRIRAALDLASKAVEVQRAEGEYRAQAVKTVGHCL